MPNAPSTPNSTHVYLRADDFGATPGTNEAIVDAVACGTIRNVGVLAVGEYLDHCLEALIEASDRVSIGLHAAIHCESPVLGLTPVRDPRRIRSLLDENGQMFPAPVKMEPKPDPGELLAEVAAQLDYLQSRGLRPVYLDTHMGFEWLPGVFEPLRRFCFEKSLWFVNHDDFPKLFGPKDADWSRMPPDSLVQRAASPPEAGAVWISHPAYPDAVSEKAYGSEAAERRGREARLMIDPTLCDSLRAADLVLDRFAVSRTR